MKLIIILVSTLVFSLQSCQSEASLQKYFVDHTNQKDFVVVDVSPSILKTDKMQLTPEQNQALQSFEKMNVLAFKCDGKNQKQYELEAVKVKSILKNEKYQELMKFGSGHDGASVSFVGEDEHIDEFVLYANKKENGFAVVRVLGKDMNPTMVLSMLSILKESNLDMEQLKPLQKLLAP